MNWLQNLIIILISFLLARIIIDSNIHQHLVTKLINKSRSDMSSLITAILLISYGLSLFFPNTIVVLSMIPIIKFIVNSVNDKKKKKIFSTNLILALIYGANIGGMGSLIGSPANIMCLSFIEINKISGKENVTFFSWLLFGIPTTLVLIFISRLILKIGEKGTLEINQLKELSKDKDGSRPFRYITFFIINLVIIILLTALQFLFKPSKMLGSLNIIDILLLIYLGMFLFFSFIFPRTKKTINQYLKNGLFLVLFIVFFPIIFLNEAVREIKIRLRLQKKGETGKLDLIINYSLNRIWLSLFKENFKDLKQKNDNVYVSINRLIYDLPFFGLLFMGFVIFVVYLILKIGDNPATTKLDGYVFTFLKNFSTSIIPNINNLFLFLLVIVFISIFVTEIVNNTTVVLIFFPIIIQIASSLQLNPLFLLMAVSIASTGAFMTPIATSVNAIAFASIRGVSLKKMLKLGFFLNLISGLWITLIFHFLNK